MTYNSKDRQKHLDRRVFINDFWNHVHNVTSLRNNKYYNITSLDESYETKLEKLDQLEQRFLLDVNSFKNMYQKVYTNKTSKSNMKFDKLMSCIISSIKN